MGSNFPEAAAAGVEVAGRKLETAAAVGKVAVAVTGSSWRCDSRPGESRRRILARTFGPAGSGCSSLHPRT